VGCVWDTVQDRVLGHVKNQRKKGKKNENVKREPKKGNKKKRKNVKIRKKKGVDGTSNERVNHANRARGGKKKKRAETKGEMENRRGKKQTFLGGTGEKKRSCTL